MGCHIRSPNFWTQTVRKRSNLLLLTNIGFIFREILGGGEGTCIEILSKFSALCRSIFSKKWQFFGNFRDTSTQITPKSTFYCFFIKKFPQNLQKVAEKSSFGAFCVTNKYQRIHFWLGNSKINLDEEKIFFPNWRSSFQQSNVSSRLSYISNKRLNNGFEVMCNINLRSDLRFWTCFRRYLRVCVP